MKIYEISWFKDFACLCGDCPQSCCKGWVIPLSDRDCERFRHVGGRLGIALFFATGGWIRAKFNTGSGECPFHQKDGLCRLQKERGHDFIPWTCQSYPRFYRNYGAFEEACLDLSCIGAAQLFIKNDGALDVTGQEGDPETELCTTNEDSEFLKYLIKQREMMTKAVRSGLTQDMSDALFLFAVRCQDVFAKGQSGTDLSFDVFFDEFSKERRGKDMTYPFPATVLTQLLRSRLYHPRLRVVDPYLYRVFTKASEYLKNFGKKGEDFREKAKAFLCDNPRTKRILDNYLAYYLYQYYLRIYETYSFRRQVALGICHMNMVLLLVMSEHEGREVSDEGTARIIASYNRRAYFNDWILDEMYRIFEKNYDIIR